MNLPYLLTGLQIHRPNDIFLRGVLKELEEKRVPHAFVARFKDGVWSRYMIWNGVTAQCLEINGGWRLFCLCADGTVHVKTPSGEAVEMIDPSGGPNAQRWMLDLRFVAGTLHAVGMRRMAYRRGPSGNWTSIGAGAEPHDDEPVDVGFRSIDGFGLDELYAAGFEGEIWRRDATRWQRVASPTNVRLDKVVALPSGEILLGGAGGVLTRGRGQVWSVIEHGVTEDVITDIACFSERVFVADGSQLFELTDDMLIPFPIDTEPPVRARYMHVGAGVLGVVGRDAAALFDGTTWRAVPMPRPARPA